MQRRLQNSLGGMAPQNLARWGTRAALIGLLCLSVVLMIGFVRMTWTRHQLNQQIAEQRVINEEKRQEVDSLKGEAEFRKSDVYVERAAREQLGMARDGETVIMPNIVDAPAPSVAPSTAPRPSAAAETVAPEAQPNYARWWQAFFPAPVAQP